MNGPNESLPLITLLLLTACGPATASPSDPPCRPGTFECSGASTRACRFDTHSWGDWLSCPYACEPGEGCVGECKPWTLMVDCLGTHVCSELGGWDPPDYNASTCADDGGVE